MTTPEGVPASRRTSDAWLVVAVAVLALGLAVDLHRHSPIRGLSILAALTLIAGVTGIALRDEPPVVGRALLIGLPGLAALMMSLDGLASMTPWLLLVVLMLMAASRDCRSVTVCVARWLLHEHLPTAPAGASTEERAASRARHPSTSRALPGPDAVATRDLAQVWTESYFALLTTASEPERRRIVELRAQYLDKLEESDPLGFAAWLDAGADPARAFRSDAS